MRSVSSGLVSQGTQHANCHGHVDMPLLTTRGDCRRRMRAPVHCFFCRRHDNQRAVISFSRRRLFLYPHPKWRAHVFERGTNQARRKMHDWTRNSAIADKLWDASVSRTFL